MKEFYGAVDVGSSVCELSVENEDNDEVYAASVPTSEKHLVRVIREGRRKYRGRWHLTIEEGEMAQWMAGFLRKEVDRFVVCDPRRNAWVAKDRYKNDRLDARKLAGLLRGNFVKEIYHTDLEDRVEFKRVVQHYHAMTSAEATLKGQIKAKFRNHGIVIRKVGFHPTDRALYLSWLPTPASRQLIRNLFELLDATLQAQERAKKLMVAIGRNFPEVAQLQKIFGVGPVWGCTFPGLIQTPHRFKNKRKLWRYCGLGVTDRSSNGQPLGYRRVDRDGVRLLKHLSYHVFLSASKRDCEFGKFYRESLQRTQDKTHARLNTQRKILATMWTIWKNNDEYRPEGGARDNDTQLK